MYGSSGCMLTEEQFRELVVEAFKLGVKPDAGLRGYWFLCAETAPVKNIAESAMVIQHDQCQRSIIFVLVGYKTRISAKPNQYYQLDIVLFF